MEAQAQAQAHARKPPPKRAGPSEFTNAENFYYSKQIQMKTPMVVVLRDGEKVEGEFEWYDRACVKLKTAGGPMLIYKSSISYLYKNE